MSLQFSRRSFLKYSALTAVAVAGSGLFTGCSWFDPDTPVTQGAGSMTVLKVTAAMGTYDETAKTYTAPDITGTKVTFPLKITNGRSHALCINPKNFYVTVTDTAGTSTTYGSSSVTLDDGKLYHTNLKTDRSVEGTLSVQLKSALKSGETITLTYLPDIEYNEYSMSWVLTRS